MNKDLFITELSKLRENSTFLSLKGYVNSVGEKADYNIVFHVSYESLLKRSLMQLELYIPENELEISAKKDLIQSYSNSLLKIGEVKFEKLEKNYKHLLKEDGSHIKGIKVHLNSGDVYLYGLIINKKILKEGNYSEVKRKPLTIAKNKISKNLPINSWRQFRIAPQQVDQVIVEKIKINI